MKPYASYKPSGVPWLGDVPAHWGVVPLKFFLKSLSGGSTIKNTVAHEYVPGLFPAFSASGQDVWMEDYEFDSPGIVVSAVGARCGKTFRADGQWGTVANTHVLLPAEGSCRDYFWYLTNDEDFWDKGGTAQPFVKVSSTLAKKVAAPSPDEQQAIADYLDVETARIDTLIHEKDKLIGLLREWRQSVIAEYTSGANQSQPPKATGNVHMPWIPSDWSMVRLGKYARIGNGSTPLKDNASYWEGGTFPWLNSAVVNRDSVDEGSEYVTDTALRACHLPIVEPGALLVALTGQGKTRGQVTVLRIQATINQHLAYLALDESRFDFNYLFWTLTGMYAALRMVSDGQGGTKGALTCDDLARFEVPMPSLSLQREIAKVVSSETAKIDDLIAHTHEEITLLKELRAATIADAVLGRVDVRTAPRQ